MTCFGYYDETVRDCIHCTMSRQCKSVRVTHGEELEASLLETLLADMSEEEIVQSQIFKILTAPPSIPEAKPRDPDPADPLDAVIFNNDFHKPVEPALAKKMIEFLGLYVDDSRCTQWEKDFIKNVSSVNIDRTTGKQLELTPARQTKVIQLYKKFRGIDKRATPSNPNHVLEMLDE